MTSPDATAVSHAVASFGLAGSLASWPGRPLGEHAWHELLFRVRAQRLSSMLAVAVTDGRLPATPRQVRAAMDMQERALISGLHLEALAIRVTEALEVAGIPTRLLKGAAVAHLDYPDPGLRDFGDIDLLVRPAQFDQSVATMHRQGFVRRFPEPRRGFDRRFTKSVCVVDADGHEVDIHRTLAPGPFGVRVVVDDLWDGAPSRFVLGGRAFDALGPEARLLHACYHSALGDIPPRLVPLRDIAEMLLGGTVDPDGVLDLAARWRGEAIVAHAITTAWRTLQLTDVVALSAWAGRYVAGRRDRGILERATSPGYTYAVQAFDSVRAIRGPRDRLAFLAALVFPRRTYVYDRHPGQGRRFRRAATEVLGARSTRPRAARAQPPVTQTRRSTNTGGEP